MTELLPHPDSAAQRLIAELRRDVRTLEAMYDTQRLRGDRLGADLGRLLEAAAGVAALGHRVPAHDHHLAGTYEETCFACAVERLITTARAVTVLYRQGSWPRPIVLTETTPVPAEAPAGTGSCTAPPT